MSDSGFTTNVPSPVFGPNGYTAPTEQAILNGAQADINNALGGNVNPQLSAPQGQIASSQTAIIGDSNAQFLSFINGVDPAYNSGRMQDGIGRIYFMARIPGAPTVQPCTCSGAPTTVVPIGVLAQDQNGNLWISQQTGKITIGVVLNFASVTKGPVPAPVTLTIYQGVDGLESITPTGAAILGNNVETPAQFEARRKASVAVNANQIADAILGNVLAVSGVLDAYVYDNSSGATQVVGGVTLGASSIYACVLGGPQDAVAAAIWQKKGPGAAYNGNTFVTVSDPNPAYNPPAPQYTVAYETPTIVPFVAQVTLQNNSGIPSTALTSISNAIISAFAGLDGGSRAKIGSYVLASRYYAGIVVLGPWAQLISVQIGKLASGATFTGSVTANILTVSAVASGTLAVGQLIQDASNMVGYGITIAAFLTGTGGTGTYRISLSFLTPFGPETMTATNLVNEVLMNINQAPAISAANINLVIQS
ncbi:MAG: baseplate J/gp47 family protein [Elusimicrobia bacterium]|nr:baseplate J/gp47 family protein [Elusimicrobiota bacterium]